LCGGTFEVIPGVEVEEYQSEVEEDTQGEGSPGPCQGPRYRIE